MSAEFRFYARLNDFLPPERRHVSFTRRFMLTATVKDMIEALGIPHPEVGLILVDGQPAGFGHLVGDRERIAVYPPFEALPLPDAVRVGHEPAPEPRFVLDRHLGRLARYLRLLGLDAAYPNDRSDDELAEISVTEARVLLSRDIGLLKRGSVTHAYFLRETDPRRQVVEVVRRFGLAGSLSPFSRCMCCNDVLEPAGKQAVAGRVPPLAWGRHDEFRVCAGCDRVYWEGTHYERLRRLVDEVRAAGADRIGG
jgi:hypothetical protein